MKKKRFNQGLCIILIAGMSLSITGCLPFAKSDEEQVMVKEPVIIKKLQVHIEELKILEDYVEGEVKIPIISNLSKTKVEDDINFTLKNDIMGFVDEQIFLSKYYSKDVNFSKLLIESDSEVTFESDNIISILIIKKVTDGKEYSSENKIAYNFDLNTGRIIDLDKIIDKEDDYKKTIKDYIEKNFEEKNNIRKVDISDRQYYMRDGKVVVFFKLYMTNEEYDFEIPFEAIKGGVNLHPILEPRSVDIDIKKTAETNEFLEVDISIPVISGLEDENIQDKINNMFEEDALSFKKEIEKQAKQFYEGNKEVEYELPKYTVDVRFEEKRNQGELLSIYVTYYQYTGGAHGFHNDVTYNIDLKTGEVVSLKDIFEEGIDYKKIIDNKIKEQIQDINEDEKNFLLKSEQSEENYYPAYEQFEGIRKDQTYYLTDDKLGVYFGLYEIAPYAAGVPVFEIPFKDLKGFIKQIQ